MDQGVTVCRRPGLPASWPPGHAWSSIWKEVTCPACLAGLHESVATCRVCSKKFELLDRAAKPLPFCAQCAQAILARIDPMVPKAPQAITWEQGVAILDALQQALKKSPC
jgi:predicted amidophosphoribosyltransferase